MFPLESRSALKMDPADGTAWKYQRMRTLSSCPVSIPVSIPPFSTAPTSLNVLSISLADQKGGGVLGAGPCFAFFSSSIFFISFFFLQFSVKILASNRFLPQTHGLASPFWEILDPPLYLNDEQRFCIQWVHCLFLQQLA